MTFTPHDGTLTLTKATPGLEPLELFFDVLLSPDPFAGTPAPDFVITGARQSPAADGLVTLTGETAAFGRTAAVTLVSRADSGALVSLTITQPLDTFDDLALLAIPSVRFANLAHELRFTAPPEGTAAVEGLGASAGLWRVLRGELHLGDGVTIPFSIANPASGQSLLVEADFAPQRAPGLTDLVALFQHPDHAADGAADLAWLPEELRDTKLLTLRDLALKIDPAASPPLTMARVTIDVTPGHTWPIIPGVAILTVGKLWLSVEVDYPLEPDYRFPIVQFGGAILLGAAGEDGEIDVTARWPDFAIRGALPAGKPIRLGALLRQLGLELAGLPEGDDELLIRTLSFSAEPTSAPRRYSFAIDIANLWDVPLPGKQRLRITRLSCFLSYTGPRGQTPSSTAISLLGGLNIAGVDLTLTAAHNGPDSGWEFEGGTGDGQQIPMRDLIDDLSVMFGALTPPAQLRGLSIANLRLRFNTRSKDALVGAEVRFPIGVAAAPAVDLTITIDIRAQADGSFTKRFAGRLTVAGMELDVAFETDRQASGATAQLFLAAYRDLRGHHVAVDDLLRAIGIAEAATGLSFTVNEALLAYAAQTDSAGAASSRWLFGINIAAGLNLSALKIDNLPLISAALPPDQRLALEFQVLAPTQPFTLDEVGRLNSLSGDAALGLPPQSIDATALAVALRIGAERRQLNLPLGLQPPGARVAGQTGLVARPGAPASGTTGGAIVAPDGVHWVALQKQLGPLAVQRVGVSYAEQQIHALLDAALAAGGLTLGLSGLEVSSPISSFAPTFSLNGLSISYRNGPVEIDGALLRQADGFAGLATIRTAALTLAAIGAYSTIEKQTSLFIYALLNYPLGGPAFFYVTGLAAGFGYNRRVIVPPIEQIATFPLVAEAVGGDAPSLPADQQGQRQLLNAEVGKLAMYIPPTIGEYFFAVGIKFTTFKQVDSFALLVVQFGQRCEIDLLGLSTLLVPSPDEDGGEISPVAEAQMALRATFAPDDGVLGIRAQLTANSYILSRACRLTGGFAFFSWFSGEHSGDFVITLGGYHPAFRVPDHYPQVPRLGFTWQVTSQFLLKGGLYFALTGHALMAGGELDALFESEHVRAWFRAGADFLIAWKPYQYDIRVFVDMGIEVIFELFGTQHLGLSASADVHLWGPEFACRAHVEVKILFITIPINIEFGGHPPVARPIPWTAFRQSFLPARDDEVCTIAAKGGLVRTIQKAGAGGGQEEWWVMNASELSVVTNSVIPSTDAGGIAAGQGGQPAPIAIHPMGVLPGEVAVTHTIVVTGLAPGQRLTLIPIVKSVPSALWGPPHIQIVDGARAIGQPDPNDASLVHGALAGFELRSAAAPVAGITHAIDRQALLTEVVRAGSGTPVAQSAPTWRASRVSDVQGADAWSSAAATLTSNPARAALLAALGMEHATIDIGQPADQDVVLVA